MSACQSRLDLTPSYRFASGALVHSDLVPGHGVADNAQAQEGDEVGGGGGLGFVVGVGHEVRRP